MILNRFNLLISLNNNCCVIVLIGSYGTTTTQLNDTAILNAIKSSSDLISIYQLVPCTSYNVQFQPIHHSCFPFNCLN